MEGGIGAPEIFIHSKNGVIGAERNFNSEELVSKDLVERRKIYEKYHSPESAQKIDQKRVFDFIAKETGLEVNSSIFVINENNKSKLVNEKGYVKDRYHDFSDMFDGHTNSAVVFDTERTNPVFLEGRLVHELAHASGIRVLKIDTNEKDDGGKDINYSTERLGLRTDSKHGSFLEEMFASSKGQRYIEKFADQEYFSFLSNKIGVDIRSFEDIKDYTFNYPDPPIEGVPTVQIPAKYADFKDGDLKSGQTAVTAYSFDLLERAVYGKTGLDLKTLMMEARMDPHKINNLAQAIDHSLGSGSFQRLRMTTYGNTEDLPNVISTLKFLQSVT